MKVWQCPICKIWHGSRQTTEECFADCLDKIEASFMCTECNLVYESYTDAVFCRDRCKIEAQEAQEQTDFERYAESGVTFGKF